MGWEVIPDDEMPKVLDAIKSGRCVACYGAIDAECGGNHALYCHDHDDGCFA